MKKVLSDFLYLFTGEVKRIFISGDTDRDNVITNLCFARLGYNYQIISITDEINSPTSSQEILSRL